MKNPGFPCLIGVFVRFNSMIRNIYNLHMNLVKWSVLQNTIYVTLSIYLFYSIMALTPPLCRQQNLYLNLILPAQDSIHIPHREYDNPQCTSTAALMQFSIACLSKLNPDLIGTANPTQSKYLYCTFLTITYQIPSLPMKSKLSICTNLCTSVPSGESYSLNISF